MVGTPDRQTILTWARGHCPDLRIQHRLGASYARFTCDGKVYELRADGDDAQDAIVVRIWETIREAHGMPVPGRAKDSGSTLREQIVAASLNGRPDIADQLAAQLVTERQSRAFVHRPAATIRDYEPGSQDFRQRAPFGRRSI
jgi:hypothetical protein